MLLELSTLPNEISKAKIPEITAKNIATSFRFNPAMNAMTAITRNTKVYAASAPPAKPHQKLVLSYSILFYFLGRREWFLRLSPLLESFLNLHGSHKRVKERKKMAEEKIRMPASFGGLTRYFEDYKSKIVLKPEYVIVIIAIVILGEVALRIFF